MTRIRDCATFAVSEHGWCRHCGERIEWRRRLGWLHVDTFFTCAAPRSDDGDLKAATP